MRNIKIEKYDLGCFLLSLCIILQVHKLYYIHILILFILLNRIVAINKKHSIKELKEKKNKIFICCFVFFSICFSIITKNNESLLILGEINQLLITLCLCLYILFPKK